MEDQLFNDEMLIGIRTGAKLIEVKKTNGLVKLNKEFLGIELGFLNKKELELLYILCLAFKERKVQSIKIHIKEIKELMSNGEKEIRKTDLENYVETLHKRLAKVNIRTNKSGISGTLNLFEYVLTDTRDYETGIVTIIAKVTDTAMNFFNNLEGKRNKYLRFLIEDAIKLKGKYSALLLPHLIACSKDKKFEISFENLEELLGIKGKYSRKTDFNKRILKPTIEELEIIFKDLKVKPLKKNELDPRKITHYFFNWSNNINYDDKKEETSFFVEIEETNSNDKKEYSKVFINNDNVIEDKTEEIEVAVADVDVKEVTEVEAEVIAETDDLKECELYIKRNIFAEINFNSIKKEVKELIDNMGKEETLKYFSRTWKRLEEQQKKGKVKNRTAYFIYLIKSKLETTPTDDELREMARIEESRQYEERQKEKEKNRKGNNKSEWDSPTEAKEEVKKEVVKEVVEEKKIEIISYKEYLEIKETELKKLEENSNPTGIKELDLGLRKMNFFNLFRKKIQVNLTKKEWEQERKNLKNYFKSTDEIIKQELEKISVIIEEKEEVKKEKEVAEVEAEEKANFKIFTIEEIEKVEKELEELKEWEDEISKLPAFLELDEIYYNLYCLYRDRNKTETSVALDKEIADLESKRKKLELQLEEEKKELWNRRFSDSAKQKRNNIKSIKDFTVKEVAVADVKDVKKEVAVAVEETDPFDEKDIASIFKK
jgi:possible replication protein